MKTYSKFTFTIDLTGSRYKASVHEGSYPITLCSGNSSKKHSTLILETGSIMNAQQALDMLSDELKNVAIRDDWNKENDFFDSFKTLIKNDRAWRDRVISLIHSTSKYMVYNKGLRLTLQGIMIKSRWE